MFLKRKHNQLTLHTLVTFIKTRQRYHTTKLADVVRREGRPASPGARDARGVRGVKKYRCIRSLEDGIWIELFDLIQIAYHTV